MVKRMKATSVSRRRGGDRGRGRGRERWVVAQTPSTYFLANEPTSPKPSDDAVTGHTDANLDGVREVESVAQVSERNGIVNTSVLQAYRSPKSRRRPHRHSILPV
jgi:hypothetical protein